MNNVPLGRGTAGHGLRRPGGCVVQELGGGGIAPPMRRSGGGMIETVLDAGLLLLAGIGLAVVVFALLDICEMLLARLLDD